jgi:hypothetical protein
MLISLSPGRDAQSEHDGGNDDEGRRCIGALHNYLLVVPEMQLLVAAYCSCPERKVLKPHINLS